MEGKAGLPSRAVGMVAALSGALSEGSLLCLRALGVAERHLLCLWVPGGAELGLGAAL